MKSSLDGSCCARILIELHPLQNILLVVMYNQSNLLSFLLKTFSPFICLLFSNNAFVLKGYRKDFAVVTIVFPFWMKPSAGKRTMDLLPDNRPAILLAHAERHKSP